MMWRTLMASLLFLFCHECVGFFVQKIVCRRDEQASSSQFIAFPSQLLLSTSSSDSWSVTDDWQQLSQENPRNGVQSEDIFNQILADKAAWSMQSRPSNGDPQDAWLEAAVNAIHENDVTPAEADVDPPVDPFLEELGQEISLLVRCNEDPTRLLIQSGRALPPLTQAECDDVHQLIDVDFRPTAFLRHTAERIFRQYAVGDAMTRREVAQWFSVCSQKVVGPHDGRVQGILARYSEYGSGVLTTEGMLHLYVDALLGDCTKEAWTLRTLNQVRREEIRQVWRDIRTHGIVGPIEFERQQLLKQDEHDSLSHSRVHPETLMDECIIVDESLISTQSLKRKSPRSSHELVELADDGKTPLWMKDGDFVFIDEESCIGCTQCVLAAPGSFFMTEFEGRARTFSQRASPDVAAAVSACPVDCMHFVSFRELKDLELARDGGDGRTDHRHFGSGSERGYIPLTPLHVSGRASDSNHKSSWYHYLRSKCYKSKQCPQRGCYDCPLYQSDPDSNPHYQHRLREANHVRAEHFINHGLADSFRKAVEL